MNPADTDADRLIRALIATRRPATAEEIERMATAQFATLVVRVPVEERGARYQHHTLSARADSLTYHLVKRVALERQ